MQSMTLGDGGTCKRFFRVKLRSMRIARMSLVIPFAALLWAQSTVIVSGRITDAATGQPIEEAAITLDEGTSHASQLTDSAGNFSFDEDIAPGAGHIQI